MTSLCLEQVKGPPPVQQTQGADRVLGLTECVLSGYFRGLLRS